jgi:hypothetical protein
MVPIVKASNLTAVEHKRLLCHQRQSYVYDSGKGVGKVIHNIPGLITVIMLIFN